MARLCRLARFLCVALSLIGGLARAERNVPVVMLSDVHFDPFHDPAKLPQLRSMPIERWPAVLSTPPSPTQPADLQALQAGCNARALDTDWPLLGKTLRAAHEAEAHPLFITLSGDLLTHEFPCRFARLVPGARPEDLAAFAAKTVAFVLAQTRATFPRAQVYAALGNNDSGCADYRETPGDAFLTSTGNSMAAAAGGLDGAVVTPEGDFSVALPAPMHHTRLIVLQDIFETRQFSTCAASADRGGERAQMDWLRAQLATARAQHEHVWVMAHVPPGVDVYTSFRRFVLQPRELCTAQPRGFLADSSLPDALLDFADIIPLALFAHTHMDELRLLRRAAQTGTPAAVIPAKLVPSVSPYLGNHPAFLVASVDPETAVLKDWRTVVSPGPEGSTPPWTEAYRFTTTYHLPDFSAASAGKLADSFTADPTGQSPDSSAFREHFYAGDFGIYALGLAQIWPAYACSVRENTPTAVHSCLCAAIPAPATPTAQP